MVDQRSKDRICLLVALFMVAASITYWCAFAINSYSTFRLSWDVANSAYDMYYHIHYPAIVHGVQYLSFAAHLAPDQLLILPIFYLYQSPLTLLFLQAVVLSLTGLLIFFISKRLLKNSFFGLLLCFAFLLNPGVHGMFISDYHAEFLIIPFVLLIFYFFMTERRIPFFASLLLLLGTIETAAFVGVALGLGLLAYELLYDGKRKRVSRIERVKLSLWLVALSIVAVAVYAYAAATLTAGYANGSYHSLPQELKVINFGTEQAGQLTTALGNNLVPSQPISPIYAIYGLMVVFLGFGISVILVPEVAFVVALPWLIEGLSLGRGNFLVICYQYFSYVIGGILVAVFLSMMALESGSGRFRWVLNRWKANDRTNAVCRTLLTLSLIVFLFAPIFIVARSLVNPMQLFLFQTTQLQRQQIGQLYSIMALIPANASVYAPVGVLSHLTDRAELAPTIGVGKMPDFMPQYVIVESNLSVAQSPWYFINESKSDNSILSSGSYYLYSKDGSAELYRLLICS